MTKLVPLLRSRRDESTCPAHPFLCHVKTAGRWPFAIQEDGPHQVLNLLVPPPWTPQPPETWKNEWLWSKLPSLLSFVTAA